ncbi:glycosyltransferase family 4 protein [Alkalilacustris brevis]|uniref:glycosyltransferase family 4 protein n=1 Tax=Alkalilacustris brevis TaxID=2026338 RepID=UPI00138FFCC4|nr:glycosyltransferase family 4 protein [Alkalilacustris brevis]
MNKLFYLSQSRLPSRAANSVHVMKMAQAFARTGLNVSLSARAGEGAMPSEMLCRHYGVEPVFDLHVIDPGGLPRPAVRYTISALRRARRAGASMIYTRHPGSGFLAEVFGWRAVVELHMPDAGRAMRAYLRVARRPLVVVITEALRRKVIADLGVDPNAVIVAPDGADPMPPEVRPALPPAAPGRLRVGFLGHLYRGKGMEVISAIAPRCPWADFEIVGGTDEDIARWRAKLDELPNLRFHGYVPHAQTPAYLKSFDVALLPNQRFVGGVGGSRNISQWTSPLKAFEYMAAGLPIIASDQPNLREVLEHEVNALLCPPDDVAAWCQALERLRENQGLRAGLGRTASQLFAERYSWQARARRLKDAVFDCGSQ